MSVTAVIGTGCSLSLSGFSFPLLEIDGGPEITRGFVGADKMSTTLWMEKLPLTLKDPGVISGRVEWDGTLPTFNAAATVTLTASNGNARSASGFLSRFKGSIPLEDKMTAEFEITVTGAWS